MAKQITQFAADDGTLFDTEAAADAHSASLSKVQAADAYIAAVGAQGKLVELLKTHLVQFQEHGEGAEPPKVEIKARKPRAKKVEAVEA